MIKKPQIIPIVILLLPNFCEKKIGLKAITRINEKYTRTELQYIAT